MHILKYVKVHFARSTKLFLVLLLTATIAPQILNIKIASADDGGYAWVGATYVDANYDWGYSTCPSNDTGCMSLYGYLNGVKMGEADPWVYNLRNCTSYVAWKINQQFNVNINGWGNAASWDANATGTGHPYTNDSSPQVGDIAQWGSPAPFGHVAYVYAVNNGVASLDEYNVAGTGLFTSNRTTASGSAGTPDHYIHIGTVLSTVGTSTSFSPYFDSARQTGLMFLHQMSTGGANVYTYNGDNSFSGPGLSTQPFLNSLGWNWSQMQVATGDGNGDGYSDLFMLHKTSDGGANLYEFPSSSGSFNNINVTNPTPAANFPGSNWSWSNMKLLVGDFGDTGKSDVMIVSKASDGGANINIYPASNGWTSSTWSENLPNVGANWTYSNMQFATGDAGASGYSGLFILQGLSSGGANLFDLKGGTGNLLPGNPIIQFNSAYSYSDMYFMTGNFVGTGNGNGDIMLLYNLGSSGANMYIWDNNYNGNSYGGPGLTTQFLGTSNWNGSYMKYATGDTSNDGISDLLVLVQRSDYGANFYTIRGGSNHYVIPSGPAQYFPSPFVWSEMLGPVSNNEDSAN